ncbi:hypothetical protein Celaphus_00011226 [Cervus elaphus hippelaphus]|uniref:Uncharacterized protein n=1 Tax=Cervus elaphus hippelaphus TaxID=46360 RepID=A0A212CQR8_CEREH|nr:hypothetical protein Celaphus_00011226 [Cervus elaphus hippelaphus]
MEGYPSLKWLRRLHALCACFLNTIWRRDNSVTFAAQDGDLAAGEIELPGMLCSRAARPRV